MKKPKKKKNKQPVNEETVLALFRDKKKPMHPPEIVRTLGGDRKDKNNLKRILGTLTDQGVLLRLRGGAFGLVEHLKLVTGRLEIQRAGMGFVIREDGVREDIYVSAKHLGKAWHGDRVAVALLPGRSGRRPEGRIARVLERGVTRMTVRAAKKMGKGLFLCTPTDPKQPMNLMVDVAEYGEKAKLGDILVVEPGERIEGELWEAMIVESLGDGFDAAVQERVVKINHDIPTKFPQTVWREASDLPGDPADADFAGRRDLREEPFVTIDGAKARDFDDAVQVTRTKKGFRLRVAIADVSHYVVPGSAMDVEARARGNSYYFPQSVEPMFPEALSNGLCSLNPDVARLAMVAQMHFRDDGTVIEEESSFYPAVIRSHARLTYMQVHRALEKNDAQEQAKLGDLMPMLREAETLARGINARRSARGSLDFDLPEPEIRFNIYGETEDIRPRPRTFAHQIIEEFMIAANEAVARFLTAKGLPCMYRIHPEPDEEKLAGLFRVLAHTDLHLDARLEPTPDGLQGLIRAAQGTDLEFMVNRLTLRTMMQASYSPQLEQHYGLASKCYCHFTSPIRRYADLAVHRALKVALGVPVPGDADKVSLKGFKKLGEELSVLERTAMLAEREILKRLTILFLRDKVGEEYTGVVNSLADFGFWVELTEVMAEGLVRLSTLDDDYYALLPERQEIVGERTARTFKLGQTVKVVLHDVNLSRLEVDLRLKESAGRRSRTGKGRDFDPFA